MLIGWWLSPPSLLKGGSGYWWPVWLLVLDTSCFFYRKGSQMAKRLENRAINQKVAGSIPGRANDFVSLGVRACVCGRVCIAKGGEAIYFSQFQI